MSLLTKKYREVVAKDKNAVKEARTGYAFKTGIDLLDWKNGKLVRVKGGDAYYSVGVEEGSYNMVIGRSGSGKTSLVMQMAAKIVEKYPNGSGITAEEFYRNVIRVCNLKLENAEELTVTTDKLDEKGNPIQILEPTVYILDSLAMLVPENIADEDDLSGGMSQTAVAKANSQIFQRIIPRLKKANVILFVINHINQKIDIE